MQVKSKQGKDLEDDDEKIERLAMCACRGNRPIPEDKQNLFLGYNGELRMGILPVSIFCSGAIRREMCR